MPDTHPGAPPRRAAHFPMIPASIRVWWRLNDRNERKVKVVTCGGTIPSIGPGVQSETGPLEVRSRGTRELRGSANGLIGRRLVTPSSWRLGESRRRSGDGLARPDRGELGDEFGGDRVARGGSLCEPSGELGGFDAGDLRRLGGSAESETGGGPGRRPDHHPSRRRTTGEDHRHPAGPEERQGGPDQRVGGVAAPGPSDPPSLARAVTSPSITRRSSRCSSGVVRSIDSNRQ